MKLPGLIVMNLNDVLDFEESLVFEHIVEVLKNKQIGVESLHFRKLQGKPLRIILTTILEKQHHNYTEESLNQLQTAILNKIVPEYLALNGNHIQVAYKAMIELLHPLGVKIVILSFLPVQLLAMVIKNTGLDNMGCHWLSYEKAPRPQPFPDAIQLLLNKYSFHFTESVARIGTSQNDLLEGYHAGCKWNILITNNKNIDDLIAYPYTHIFKNPDEVKFHFIDAGGLNVQSGYRNIPIFKRRGGN